MSHLLLLGVCTGPCKGGYCRPGLPLTTLPSQWIFPETPSSNTVAWSRIECKKGTADTSVAVSFEADATKEILHLFHIYLTQIWQGAHGYLSAFWLSYLGMVDIVFGMFGSSSSFYLCNDPMGVWIWCSQLCRICAVPQSSKEQTFWAPSRTFSRIPTKTIFCSDGLMRSFCQHSCWWG